MESLFSVDSLISLVTLTILEVVLGIDNVIFVSILMSGLNKKQQLTARKIWMIAGIIVRSILLFLVGWLVNNGNKNLFTVFGYGFNIRNLILLVGGLFLLYKTVKEIHGKLEGEDENKIKKSASFGSAIAQIIIIDMVFSFDSIITAVGLARKVPVMIIAVIIAMFIMFFFAQKISVFIHKHPTLKMLALSFLLMIGFSLFFEGLEPLHHTHIDKGYIYFAMAFSFLVELLNLWMRKKEKKRNPVELKEPMLEETENNTK
jgi:predicted tellurium resistance membrane protein TerC